MPKKETKRRFTPSLDRNEKPPLRRSNTYWGILFPTENNTRYPQIRLFEDRHTIGYGVTNTTVLGEDGISFHHCTIYKDYYSENGKNITKYMLEDKSSLGTLVQGNRCRTNEPERIYHGHIIGLVTCNGVLEYKLLVNEDPEERGSFASKWTVINHLGSGHFADVEMVVPFGEDPNDPSTRKAAVKIIKTDRLHHPKLRENLKIYNETNNIYIVMEYVPEKEFFDLIYEKRLLTESQTRKAFYQIFNAIKYLHDRNIIHRDLKPENILMVEKEKMTLKISDFGLSKILGNSDEVMTTLCGTPTYVAPEILTPRERRSYNSKVDMWSLGVILYVCLCGFPPFSNDRSPPSLTEQIRSGIYTFPSPMWDTVSENAKDLIRNLLVTNPDERFSVDEAINHPFMTAGFDINGDDDYDYLDRVGYHVEKGQTLMIIPRLRKVNQEGTERLANEPCTNVITSKSNERLPKVSPQSNINEVDTHSQLHFTTFGMQPLEGTIYSAAGSSVYMTANEYSDAWFPH
ncbi:13132_t:CDS:2 [Ambispora gerdemannii]|uniref:13132_t:CDS:1 n=1 Tax=Ambispora gerdemannii TaxID=144530 RepID=A0A9N9GKN5_9GLOM|nr:13132_t:CDS:2 [Ambispora gerdemannii]